MFPQIPFNYLGNVKIAEINSNIFLQSISIQSYIGTIKDCTSNITVSNTNTTITIGLLKYALSDTNIDNLTLFTFINLVTQSSWREITEDQWRTITDNQWRTITDG